MSIKTTIGQCRDKLGALPLIGGIIKPKDKVAIVRLSGVIADSSMRKQGISFAKCEKLLKDAFETYNLKAVALVINSPGGSPAQSELLGNHIRSLAEEHEVPVYAFIEDVAASGGYWLACAADKIYAAETSITGSIGVVSASFGLKGFIDQHGIERRIHTSGKDKSFLDPFLEEKPADVKRLKALQTALHGSFIGWVKNRRGAALIGDDKTLFEGGFWAAHQALDLGIIDGIGSVRTTCKEVFGEDIKFTEFTPDRGFLSSLIGGDASMASSMPEQVLALIEDRSLWARFGL